MYIGFDLDKLIDDYVTRIPEEEAVIKCDNCEEDIYENEYAWKFDNKVLCEDCANEKAEKWLLSHRIKIEKEDYYDGDY